MGDVRELPGLEPLSPPCPHEATDYAFFHDSTDTLYIVAVTEEGTYYWRKDMPAWERVIPLASQAPAPSHQAGMQPQESPAQ